MFALIRGNWRMAAFFLRFLLVLVFCRSRWRKKLVWEFSTAEDSFVDKIGKFREYTLKSRSIIKYEERFLLLINFSMEKKLILNSRFINIWKCYLLFFEERNWVRNRFFQQYRSTFVEIPLKSQQILPFLLRNQIKIFLLNCLETHLQSKSDDSVKLARHTQG